MRTIILLFILTCFVEARERELADMTVMPHVMVNLHAGVVVFKLTNKTVYKKLNDPIYRLAVANGQLDRLLRSSELTLDSKGYFPLPIKFADFGYQDPVDKAGIAQEYMALAHFLGKPFSDNVPSLQDLSYFIRAVKINQIGSAGLTSQHIEYVDKRSGLVSRKIEEDFTKDIPSHEDFREWIRQFMGLEYAEEQDILSSDINDIEQRFDVFQENMHRRKSLKDVNSQILARLMLMGYPMLLHQKEDILILTAVHKENIYIHFHGQRYIGTIRKVRSKRIENALTVFKLKRDDSGQLKTKLAEMFEDAAPAPIAAPAVVPALDEEGGVQLLSLKELVKEPAKYEGKSVLFSCRVVDFRLKTREKTLYLKAAGHYLKISPLSKGYYLMIKEKVDYFKRHLNLNGEAVALKGNTPLFFKGVFTGIENNKVLNFEDLESLSYTARMKELPRAIPVR